jgi:hypothetical protein
MGEACSTNGGEEERVYVMGGKAREKDTLGRPRHRWVDNMRGRGGMG